MWQNFTEPPESSFEVKSLSAGQFESQIARFLPLASSRWPPKLAEAEASPLPVTVGLIGLDWEASHRSQASILGWSGPF